MKRSWGHSECNTERCSCKAQQAQERREVLYTSKGFWDDEHPPKRAVGDSILI
jgi:hypothetical protein